jgi:hypothetical protein
MGYAVNLYARGWWPPESIWTTRLYSGMTFSTSTPDLNKAPVPKNLQKLQQFSLVWSNPDEEAQFTARSAPERLDLWP